MARNAALATVEIANIKGVRRETSGESSLARASNVKLRCGDCLHHKGTAHPSMGQSCATLGVGVGATAPNCYTPNVSIFREHSTATLQALFVTVASFSPQQQRVFMGLLRNASSLNRTGYSFMETVYFTTERRGEASLSDYYRGFVAAPGPADTLQIVGINFLNGTRTSCVAFLDKSSLISRKVFDKRKKALIAKGALESLPKRIQISVAKDDYQPPTLDTAEDFLARNAVKAKKHKTEIRAAQEKSWVIDQSAVDAEDGL